MPEAEPAVARLRSRHDPSAAHGVPAHVTVLYPFLDTTQLDDLVRGELEELFAGFAPFRCVFPRVGWFPGVAYLVPEPDAPFRDLTAAVFARWPDHPPYEGAHDDVVPHLTVADTADTTILRHVGAEVAGSLPIETGVDEIELWVEQPDGTWCGRRRFRLGRP